jgi:hypothetical protein
MALHTFDGGGADDGTVEVSLFTFYGEEYVWTDIVSGETAFGLNADQARAYAADLAAHADALDERNAHPIISYGLTAQQHRALEAAAAANLSTVTASQAPRPTVLVAATHPECDRWCDQNDRNPRDRTIIRVLDRRNLNRVQSIGDFDLVVLSEIDYHSEVMAELNYRLRRHGKDPV